MRIGLVGFGRLGKLITKYLAQDCDLHVYDTVEQNEEIERLGARSCDLKTICSLDIILLAVPISKMQVVLQEMVELGVKNSLIIDTCSVKSMPEKWMEEILPEDYEILGTHPMFGPDSAAETLFGAKIVLCPIRICRHKFENISRYLEKNGLYVIEESADEHDRQIAESLVLTHFIGRGLIDYGVGQKRIDTKGHRRLMKILLTVQNDAWQLFVDMNKYNPYAKKTLDGFLNSLKNVQEKMESENDSRSSK